MASSNPSANLTLSDMQRAVKDTVHHHWQLFLTQGVIWSSLAFLPLSGLRSDHCRRRLCRLAVPASGRRLATMFLCRRSAFLWSLLRRRCVCRRHPAARHGPKARSRTPGADRPLPCRRYLQIAASAAIATYSRLLGWMLASGIADLILAARSSRDTDTATWALGLIVD